MSSETVLQVEIQKNYLLGEENAGLKFMAIQFNIKDKRRFLQTEKLITPSEYFMLEEIECGTIGARNKKKTIDWTAEFYLEDFAGILKIGINKVYVHLKSLHRKNLIIRYPTRSKGLETIGLNPAVFGQILCDKHETLVTNRKSKVILKKNPKTVPIEQKKSPKITPLVPNQDKVEHEKPALDSFRSIKTSLEGKSEIGESLSLEERERERINKEEAQLRLSKLIPGLFKSMPIDPIQKPSPGGRPVQMSFL